MPLIIHLFFITCAELYKGIEMCHKTTLVVIILSFVFVGLTCCKSSSEGPNNVITAEVDTSSIIVNYEGSLFPIPSSWEINKFIKKFNLPFNQKFASPRDVSLYTTTFKQALNLGALGTDVSYLNIYDEVQTSIILLASIKQLCMELGLDPIFDNNVFGFIERNINRPDSITNKVSSTYSASNNYLNANNRSDVGALIIVGAWIESIYILTQIAEQTNNREIINRIGEQKYPLNNLIELLTPFYYKSADISGLIDEIIDLNNEFENIIYSYTYKQPTVLAEQKHIIINSQSRIVISEFHLQTITQKVKNLRNMIVE